MEAFILVVSLCVASLALYIKKQVDKSQIVPPFGLIALPRTNAARVIRKSVRLFLIVLISAFAVFELLQASIASIGRMLIGV